MTTTTLPWWLRVVLASNFALDAVLMALYWTLWWDLPETMVLQSAGAADGVRIHAGLLIGLWGSIRLMPALFPHERGVRVAAAVAYMAEVLLFSREVWIHGTWDAGIVANGALVFSAVMAVVMARLSVAEINDKRE